MGGGSNLLICDPSLSLSLSLAPAKGVYRTLFLSKPPEKNEHFFPGRMVCCAISITSH